jgi:hypothetical protein
MTKRSWSATENGAGISPPENWRRQQPRSHSSSTPAAFNNNEESFVQKREAKQSPPDQSMRSVLKLDKNMPDLVSVTTRKSKACPACRQQKVRIERVILTFNFWRAWANRIRSNVSWRMIRLRARGAKKEDCCAHQIRRFRV